MTELFINNKRIDLNDSISIKLVDENPYFTRSSKYTYDIEVPLKGNTNNLKVLGNIQRMDVSKKVIKMPAKIVVNNRTIINGTATMTSVSDDKIKFQILAGNAEFNFLSKYEKNYIDELDLGYIPTQDGGYTPNNDGLVGYYGKKEEAARYKAMFGKYGETNYVFFPIYNELDSYTYNKLAIRKMNEKTETVFFDSQFYGEVYQPGELWSSGGKLAVQPYYCFIIRQVFTAFGYTIIENQIENSPLKDVFIANSKYTTVFKETVPHWTVTDFLEQTENFFGVIFSIDDIAKTVKVKFRSMQAYDKNVLIENAIDEYSVNCDEDQTEDISNANMTYSFQDVDKYLRISDDIIKHIETKSFDTYDAFLTYYKSLSDTDKYKYLYKAEGKEYICYQSNNNTSIKEVNQYRDLVRNENNDSNNIELKIIPINMTIDRARWEGIAYSDFFKHYYPTKGQEFNMVMLTSSGKKVAPKETNIQNLIEGTTSTSDSENGIMEIAMNDGIFQPIKTDDGKSSSTFPWPFVLTSDLLNGEKNRGFSFELNEIKGRTTMYDTVFGAVMQVNTVSEIAINFITDNMYDTMSRFIIRNKAYLCEKIEYKIDAKGIAKEKTGYFYEADS
jgi:hypothetical protein